MKSTLYILTILTAACLAYSCEDYLEKTPASDISEEQVFGNYRNFQGYLDELYGTGLIRYIGQCFTASMDFGDDVYNNKTFPVSFSIPSGDYMWIYRNTSHNPFRTIADDHVGIWDQGIANIRRANHGLERLDYLAGTDEERDLLKGQALFFRAWNHLEIAKYWGGIPYMDKYFSPDDDMHLKRLSFRQTLLKVAEDAAAAAQLLPVNWDTTTPGSLSPGSNTGRVTRGAAYALQARALLYAASPLASKTENGSTDYDNDLCELAAKAAYEVLKLADSGVYSLVPWSDYHTMFCDTRSTVNCIWTSETIFAKITTAKGSGQVTNLGVGRVHNSQRFGGNGVVTAPTANFVRLYETATGYAIEDAPPGDFNPLIPWKNRDPRLYADILVDGVKWVAKKSDASAYIQLYSAGGTSANGMGLDRDPQAGGSNTGYLIRKYIPYKVNQEDKGSEWNNFRYQVPYIRLSEMYLTYAEAVNEVYGPTTVPTWSAISAADAVNTVRRRVKLPETEDITIPKELTVWGTESLPDVRPIYTASKEKFRERIWNERSVELAFEGHRFIDLRRWYVAHLPEHKVRTAAEFDKDHTFYREVTLFEGPFEEKHYWLPFATKDVQQYADFTQNPGW